MSLEITQVVTVLGAAGVWGVFKAVGPDDVTENMEMRCKGRDSGHSNIWGL